ncbi:hypothetical protein [Streptomyces cyaneofuscatus]|uniref:hypothetical protein n=1 Tax=Streptomyces cyaneofuscatus TaxID=66883 RepID=UPI0033348ECC
MPKQPLKPGIAVIALLLVLTAASTILACEARTEEDAVARSLFTIAVLVFTGCCLLTRHRNRNE